MKSPRTPSIAVLVATYNRPVELGRLLDAISIQTLKPSIVVVVDSSRGEAAVASEAVCRSHQLSIMYLASDVGSLTKQKNFGIRELRALSPDFVQILDDDTVPEPDYIEKLFTAVSLQTGAVGASGVTDTRTEKLTTFECLKKIVFVAAGLTSFREGAVSSGGCGIPVKGSSSDLVRTSWLIGCSLWDFDIFSKVDYEESLLGSCLFEDVIFSVQAARFGALVVDPSAILGHEESPLERPNSSLFAYRFARNRWFVIRARGTKISHVVAYVAGNLILAFSHALKYLARPSRENLKTSGNYLRGMVDAWAGVAPK